jgi:hypothetical protein
VMFTPAPPLSAELDDGSYRPGATYELRLAGLPRPDAIRSLDGGRLQASLALPVQIARFDQAPTGLPAPLRPPPDDLPFLLRSANGLQRVPVDAPRLQLHFTVPVLPSSVRTGAFEVVRMRDLRTLAPRSARVVSSRLDAFLGSSVELDLGAGGIGAGGISDGSIGAGDLEPVLRAGDTVCVVVRSGDGGVCDLSGATLLLPPPPCSWEVVSGADLVLAEWPRSGEAFAAGDGLAPGFEVRAGTLRPKVRVEAGDGSLGVFCPQRDVVLQPGVPFDRGDGQLVASRGRDLPFLAIAIPAGVQVTLQAGSGGLCLRSCGDVRINGGLELRGPRAAATIVRTAVLPIERLIEATPLSIVAAGDIHLNGPVRSDPTSLGDGAPLLLASAGQIALAGELPVDTVLAVEGPVASERPAIRGPRGQSVAVATTFTYGLAAGAEVMVRAETPWRQLPADQDDALLRLRDADQGLLFAWQTAPADPLDPTRPDLTVGKVGRWNQGQDGSVLTFAPVAFVRCEISARLRFDRPLPRVREVRLVAR